MYHIHVQKACLTSSVHRETPFPGAWSHPPSLSPEQDNNLLQFMSGYYDLNTRLGSDLEEKTLATSISNLSLADSEPLVQFLYITLSNLASLLVRPSITEESGGRGFC